jgi:hypothetical protein
MAKTKDAGTAASNVEQGLAKAGQFTTEMVPDLLQVLEEKIKELKKKFGGDEKPLTNDNLDGFGNISSIDKVPNLVRAISSVKGREAAYKNAFDFTAPEITLEKFPFEINGTGAEAWVAHINQQIGKVTYKDELAKLEKGRELLKKHVSKEMQFATDMSEFKDVFGMN